MISCNWFFFNSWTKKMALLLLLQFSYFMSLIRLYSSFFFLIISKWMTALGVNRSSSTIVCCLFYWRDETVLMSCFCPYRNLGGRKKTNKQNQTHFLADARLINVNKYLSFRQVSNSTHSVLSSRIK